MIQKQTDRHLYIKTCLGSVKALFTRSILFSFCFITGEKNVTLPEVSSSFGRNL
jgi:hypothetical protein